MVVAVVLKQDQFSIVDLEHSLNVERDLNWFQLLDWNRIDRHHLLLSLMNLQCIFIYTVDNLIKAIELIREIDLALFIDRVCRDEDGGTDEIVFEHAEIDIT